MEGRARYQPIKSIMESDMEFKPPLASEVIAAIQAKINEHGDLPMALDDPDTGWILPIEIIHQDAEENEHDLEMILVESDYFYG